METVSQSRHFFSSLHDAFNNFIRIFLQVFFPVFCPVAAVGFFYWENEEVIHFFSSCRNHGDHDSFP